MDISFEEFVDMVNFDAFVETNPQFASQLVVDDDVSLAPEQQQPQQHFFELLQEMPEEQKPQAPQQPTAQEEEQQQQQQQQQKKKKKPVLLVQLKPAKSREDQYEGPNFPTTMLCTPYKYDLKFVGSEGTVLDQQLVKFDPSSLLLELVDSESLARPEVSPSETRPGLVVESIESFTPQEKVVRFALNWCSFHFRKRAFRLKATYKQELIYLSTPFHTYARRRDTPYSTYSSFASTGGKRQRHSPLLSHVQQQLFARQQQHAKQQQRSPQPFCSLLPSWIHTTRMTSATPPAAAASAVQIAHHRHHHNMVHKTAAPVPVSYHPMDAFQQLAPRSPPYPFIAPSPSPPQPSSPLQQHLLPPTQNINHLLVSLERTSMAIQLMSSLSPMEREAVHFYLSQGH